MRIYLHLSPNTEMVPFNYQQSLVGAFHKWLGENQYHDDISLYSLSWLHGGRLRRDKKGFEFRNGATFFISAPNEDLLKDLISGIFKGAHIRWGMSVQEVRMRITPEFGNSQRFVAQSPIFIKRSRPDGDGHQFFFPSDTDANAHLTETLQRKLAIAGLSTDVSVAFDPDYRNPNIKKIQFNNIDLKATFCPVIVQGDAEAVRFAWDVGVGNSTGIGFGSLR
ncbi:MAG: CRISPR-associated endoribonuclease Cas6 [Bacteroidota bacterium]